MMKYDKYKSSDIEWLGLIPEHWSAYRVDWIGKMIRGNTGFKKDELLVNGAYVALQYGKTYKVDEVNNNFNFYVNSDFYKFSQIVQLGDTILISTSETIEDLGHSCYYNRSDLGLVGGEQILLKPERKVVIEKYLYYYTKIFCGELKKYATGLKVFRFNTDDLKKIFIAIPSLEEQTAIAKYLDAKTQAIDKKIKLLNQKIDYHKELRKSIINITVTKGLDATVKLKDSGVEWIGKIPSHWVINRFKNVVKEFVGGGTPNTSQKEYWAENEKDGYLWVSIADITNASVIIDTKQYITALGLKDCSTKIIKPNTILYSIYASLGKVSYSEKYVTTNQAILAIYENKKIMNKEFFIHYLKMLEDHIASFGNSNTQNNISLNILRRIFVLLPPKEEQIAIASYLDKKSQKIDAIVTNIGRQIETLKELRKTLINVVVTGKIKVTK